MISEEYQFQEIGFACRDAVENIRHRTDHRLSAHAFVSLYLWKEEFKLSICVQEEAFFVRCCARGENAYFFPCGDKESVLQFLGWLSKQPGAMLCYVREQDKALVEQYFPGCFIFEEARGDSEYLYRREAHVQLLGGAFKNQRAKIHKARDRHIWTVSELSATHLDKVRQIVREWAEIKQNVGDSQVSLMALEQYEALGFFGVLLENENGPQAAAFGSCIASDTFDLHVTKTLIPSVDSYLKWELYRRLPQEILWINQEEDMDLPGLRTNKLESEPEYIIPLWKGAVL